MNKQIFFLFSFLALMLGPCRIHAQQTQSKQKFPASIVEILETGIPYPASYKHNINIPGLENTKETGLEMMACDTLFRVDFENQLVPPSWKNYDMDNNTDANGLPKNWFLAPERIVGTDTNFALSASSWFAPLDTANNWLITDSFTVCDPGQYLIWKSRPYEGPVYCDGYKVKLSNTDTLLSSFTVTLATFAEGIGTTPAQTPGIVHYNYQAGFGVLSEYRVSLASFFGQTIYIAFQHNSIDDAQIYLDDIMVAKPLQNNLGTVTIEDNNEYPITPLSHVQNISGFKGGVGQFGLANATDPIVNLEIKKGSTTVFSGNGTVATIMAGDTTLMNISGSYLPNQTGTYTSTYWSESPVTDLDPTNDTLSFQFFVTDSNYSRGNDDLTGGALSIGGGLSGFLGNSLEFITDDTISSATFFLETGTVMNDTIRAVIFGMIGGFPNQNQVLGMSEYVIISDTNPNFYTVTFPGGVPVTAGKVFIGLRESQNGWLRLATTSEIFTPGEFWVYFDDSWSNVENLTGFEDWNRAFYLRANLGVVRGVGIEQSKPSLTHVAITPNPSSGTFQVVFDLEQITSVTASVFDLSGKRIAISTMDNESRDRFTFNLSEFANGLYTVKIETPQGFATKKLVLSK